MNSAKDVCSKEKGTLEWALQRCEETLNCDWIHNFGCDNQTWRFCFDIDVKNYIAPNENGCAKIKLGEKTSVLLISLN